MGKKLRRQPRTGSQLHFVAQHLDRATPEIISLGAASGHVLTPKAVHTARSVLKSRGITEPIAAPLERPTPALRASSRPLDEKQQQLARLVLAIGYDRAVEAFEAVRKRIGEVV